MLPNSQRRGTVLPLSHNNAARKAFERVTKAVLPASYVQLQRAIAAEARSYDKQVGELETRGRKKPVPAAEPVHESDAPLDLEDTTETGLDDALEEHRGDELDDDVGADG